MTHGSFRRTICWTPLWNRSAAGVGLEHLLLDDGRADSVILAFDDARGPFRLEYRLTWEPSWRLRAAHLRVAVEGATRDLHVEIDGQGRWRHRGGEAIGALDGCLDVDIWPTPFTNTFPIRREGMMVGERRHVRVAWVAAPALTIQPQDQAYTRLSAHTYRFESLDGSGFRADLTVDDDGVVIDYPGLFRREPRPSVQTPLLG